VTQRDARVSVAVSGAGTNLRALRDAERRGTLGGAIVLVIADRDCPALVFGRDEGIETALIRPSDHPDRESWDRSMAEALALAQVDVLALAGFMRVLGPRVLGSDALVLNVHPSLLPAFPGRDAIDDAIDAGVRVTGVTVHVVDETLDGGPIVLQEAVPVPSGGGRAVLEERIHAVEHRLLPRAVALAAAGALRMEGGRLARDPVEAPAASDRPAGRVRRALLSVSDKSGLVELGTGLASLGFELVSTGGTAAALRAGGLSVVEVSAVTGFPEMLDGRVKTLHPRIAAGVLADTRNAHHRSQLAAEQIEPFELVVVNLYPFGEAARRPRISMDALVEEIDIGGPTLVRAAAKNHASVGIVTNPERYPAILDELESRGRLSTATRRELAREAFELTARYDALIAGELGRRFAGRRSNRPLTLPPRLDLELERVAALRYGENPHQAAALYIRPGTDPRSGPLAFGAQPLQGKALSYNNLLDASASVALARDLGGAAVVIVKHGNPCGAASTAADLLEAWERALAGDPQSAFGGVVAVRGRVGKILAERLRAIFLEVVVGERFDRAARRMLADRADLRLLEDASITEPPLTTIELRSAGGAVLATESDGAADDPATWRVVTKRSPGPDELRDLDFCWRVARHVRSNAIVLGRDRAVVGVGAGQMSRVDSARLAVDKAGAERARGSVCASDAFFPFPDGVEVLAAAGVTAFVQPGGSVRDQAVIDAADRAGATMVFTGVRHFRH
jgi:phosphoribosylaminoimidazolecarboxamide formyltransferase/IMP cyclohydrolase